MVNQRSVEYLDKLSIQLARVVLVAAYYEDELTVTIGAALDLNALQFNALVRPLNIHSKFELCKRLVADSDETTTKAVEKLARRMRKLFDQRNSLVHGTFGHDHEDFVSVRSYGGKAKLRGREERWNPEKVSKLADCILTMKDRLGELSTLLASALPEH